MLVGSTTAVCVQMFKSTLTTYALALITIYLSKYSTKSTSIVLNTLHGI